MKGINSYLLQACIKEMLIMAYAGEDIATNVGLTKARNQCYMVVN